MQKKQEEKKFEKLIRQVEARITQVEHDKNIWAIKLKEKDQEYRLNELRIKELKRQVPHKALKPLPNAQKKNSKPKPDPRAKLKKSVNKVRTSKQVMKEIESQVKNKDDAVKIEDSGKDMALGDDEPHQAEKVRNSKGKFLHFE